MGLPRSILERIPGVGEIIALKMLEGTVPKTYYFLLTAKEGPNNLIEFSLGSASALNTAGTGASQIQDGNNRYYLEPEQEKYLYLIYYGITPSYARIYRAYPANENIGSLLGVRSIGGAVGYIDGEQSPLLSPSPETEIWTLKGTQPSFTGYHPYAVPSTITVRMSFYVTKFAVEYLGAMPQGKKTPAAVQIQKAQLRSMGGGTKLVDTPEWLR